MKGLLLKDIINLKQQAKIYLLIIAVWMVIGFVNRDSGFFGGVMMIFAGLVPVSSMAYDERAKWDRYALTMPVSRNDLVLSKYLLAACCALAGGLLSILAGVILSNDLAGSVQSALVFFSLGMVFASILLPLMFRFGVEKGRMAMLVVILLPALLVLFLPKQGAAVPDQALVEKLLGLLPLIALVVVLGSILLSCAIYRRKEL